MLKLSSTSSASKWIVCPRPNPHARLRLICVPFAGGSASIFRTWPDYLPTDIEVCAVQLPGREGRLGETLFTQLTPLLKALAHAIMPMLDRPFVLFGHSMGAIISFELTRRLRRHYGILPATLMVAGRRAPQLPHYDTLIHQLPTPEFVNHLRQLDGTPAEVLEHPDLLELVLPTLRADFTVCETYHYNPDTPLDCPIVTYGGLHDRWATYNDLRAWQEQTHQPCSLHMLPGNHFFIQSSRWLLLQAMTRELNHLLHSSFTETMYPQASTFLEYSPG